MKRMINMKFASKFNDPKEGADEEPVETGSNEGGGDKGSDTGEGEVSGSEEGEG